MADPILPPENVTAKPIPGYPGYWATDDGRVWSGKMGGRFLKPGLHGMGYHFFAMPSPDGTRNRLAHRLIALAFHGPSGGRIVRHLNGDRTDNRINNLAYGTHRDNKQDEVNLGRFQKGSLGASRMSTATARAAIEMWVCGVPLKIIAARSGVSAGTIIALVRRRTWPNLRLCPFLTPLIRPVVSTCDSRRYKDDPDAKLSRCAAWRRRVGLVRPSR